MGLEAALKVIDAQIDMWESYIPGSVSWAVTYYDLRDILTAYDSDPVSPQSVDIGAGADLKCKRCGKVLPPMGKGEGEPCKTGYLCRECFFAVKPTASAVDDTTTPQSRGFTAEERLLVLEGIRALIVAFHPTGNIERWDKWFADLDAMIDALREGK